MKIEVEIEHRSGDVCRYPVFKLVKHEDGWTAHYTIVKNGRHEGRKATVGNNAALIVKTATIPTVSASPVIYKENKEQMMWNMVETRWKNE